MPTKSGTAPQRSTSPSSAATRTPSSEAQSFDGVNGTTPWRERPMQSMQVASNIAGLSTSSLYLAASRGELVLKRLCGRTLVETSSLIAFIDAADDWTPSTRASKARAARSERARAAWAE